MNTIFVCSFWAIFMVGQFLHRRDIKKAEKLADQNRVLEPEDKEEREVEHDEVVEIARERKSQEV